MISPYQYKKEEELLPQKRITYWEWRGSREYYPISSWCFFVRKTDYFEFVKGILRIQRKVQAEAVVPILPSAMLKEIYENTIEFLQRGHKKREEYRLYNIPYKRGLLLCGPAGCGKTLTCKWLRQLCIKNKLSYKIVTLETYRKAMSNGNLKALFRIPKGKRGIIFFDDMDQAVKSRESGNQHIGNFLTALDGIDSTEGIVYIFTTNCMSDLDDAFVRPGRIDVFMPFSRPSRQLRKIFVDRNFSANLKEKINTDELLEKTDEYTYAEIEEVRKLLCLSLIDGKEVSLQSTFDLFAKHRKEFEERSQFGFNKKLLEENDEFETAQWADTEVADFG